MWSNPSTGACLLGSHFFYSFSLVPARYAKFINTNPSRRGACRFATYCSITTAGPILLLNSLLCAAMFGQAGAVRGLKPGFYVHL